MLTHIAFVLPDLRPGGVERVRITLARELIARGIRVDFVLFQRRGELVSEVPAECQIFELKAPRLRSGVVPLIRYLRDQRPDAVMAHMWPVTSIATIAHKAARSDALLLVMDHTTFSTSHLFQSSRQKLAMRLSMRATYPLADLRIGVSSGVADDLSTISGLRRTMFMVIPNPAARAAEPQNDPWETGGARLLAVGSLKWAKDYPMLVRAMKHVVARRPDAHLVILGDGPERSTIEAEITEQGLHDHISMPGFARDTASWYAHAHLFVLPSQVEGFGNVLIEAMEHGISVVSTDCPGPREIMAEGRYGPLVPIGDARAFADAIVATLDTPTDPSALRKRASQFTPREITDRILTEFTRAKRERTKR